MAMAIHCKIESNKKTHHQIPIPTQDLQPLPDLPHEIIFDILSRLPVKSLLQFRSVCKSWLSLISNPQFVRSHLCITSSKGGGDDDYTHQRLVLNTFPSHTITGLKTCSLKSLDSVLEYQLWENAVDLDYPFNDLDQFVFIMGSCNGLMCVASDLETIYLLNPSTRKSKILPVSGVKKQSVFLFAYGFGFDESNDDYKVVLIVCDHDIGDSVETKVMVYTLRTDSWRQIKGFSNGFYICSIGKLVNGCLHWVVGDTIDSRHPFSIVSLHLGNETYGEVLQPNYGYAHVKLELFVLKRCLSLLCRSPKNYTDVWIMKEYGVIDSWTKLFTIQDVSESWLREILPPLCISKNGELLILYGQHLCVYDPKNGTFRDHVIRNSNHCKQIWTYVESLVAPNADNVVQRQDQ